MIYPLDIIVFFNPLDELLDFGGFFFAQLIGVPGDALEVGLDNWTLFSSKDHCSLH